MAASATACATVTRGTTQAWSVETVPGGATVRTTDGYACDATPCTFKMPRKSEFGVTITKPGYKKFETRVVHDVAGAGAVGFAGNVLIGGIVGMGVDAATGAALDLKPNPLKVTLEPELAEAAQAAAPAPAVPVAVATPAAKTP
jgi:hypothetical protein